MPESAVTLSEAMQRRRSVRAFKSTPVSEEAIRRILEVARHSPSGGNLQPWKVIVVNGAARDAVVRLAASSGYGVPSQEGQYSVYPPTLWEPYRSRRFAVGEDLYAALGIPRENRAGRLAQMAKNFEFFGAPVGIFFVIDERMGHGQWAHLGMFMQSLALAATEAGLGSCFQEIWGMLRNTLKTHFALAEHDVLYCGMALGHADTEAPINQFPVARATVDEFATFLS